MAAAKRERWFRTTRNGMNVTLDRDNGILYNDQKQVWDPRQNKWVDDPSQADPAKKPSAMEQVGTTAANVAGTAAGSYAAYQLANSLNTAKTGADIAQTANAANTANNAANAANAANTANTVTQGANTANTVAQGANTANNAAQGVNMGSVGIGLAQAGVGAYYGYAATNAYKHLASKDPEKRKRGAIETGLLATGPFLGWAAPFVSPIDEFLGSGKDKEQQTRDWSRKNFERVGLTKENKITLADGNSFDVGLDGGARLKNPDGSERRVFDVDFNDQRAAQTVADLDPLGTIYAAGNSKLQNDNTGYLVNAALSSGDTRANTLKMYADSGFTDAASVIAALDDMVARGKIDQQKRDILANSANVLFSGQQPKPMVPTPSANTGGMASLGASQPGQMQTLPQQVTPQQGQQAAQTISGQPVPQGGRPPIYKQPQQSGFVSLAGRSPRTSNGRTYV